jgi:single-strand DNA-binding protein
MFSGGEPTIRIVVSELQMSEAGGKRMSFNKILLMGFLGSDPEVRYLPSGKPTAQFRMATNRRYRLEGQMKEETEWFSIVAYGRLAEISSEFLKKGKQVFIEGRMRTRSWNDSSGAMHYRTEVIAEGLRLIGRRDSDPAEAGVSENAEPF